MKKVILILLILLLSGCYDYHELNDLEIVSSIIIDKEEGEYVTYIEVLDTSDSADKGSYFLKGHGKSFEEALDNVFFDSAQEPFYSHMNALIFSESVANDGLEEFYDFLLRDTDFRKDFYLFVTESVEDLLDYEPKPKESMGEKIKMSAMRNLEKNGRYMTSNLREVIYHYLRDNVYIIGSMAVDEDDLVLKDTFAFVDNKKDIRIEEDAVLVANILYEKNNVFSIFGDYSYLIHEYKAGKKIKKDKISISIKGNARILNATDNSSLMAEEVLVHQEAMNERIEKKFLEAIEYSRKMDVDIYNLNYSYYLYYPKEVKSDTWKSVSIDVKSNVSISEKGILSSSLGGR